MNNPDIHTVNGMKAIGLESMDLDRGLLYSVLDKEIRDICALVSLKLDDLAQLLILDDGAIASEFLSGARKWKNVEN